MAASATWLELADVVILTVFAAFVISAVLSLLAIPVCRRVALSRGWVAHPRNDRWHRHTVPMLGGVGIALATFATAAGFGMAEGNPVLLATAVLIFLIGLVDDILQVKPFTKLIGQIAVASALVYFDYRLGWVDSRLLDSLLTMFWIVGLTNAFNLLDNMDGLCAGTAFVVSVALITGLLTGASREVAGPEIIYLASLSGAVLGFLVYNFPPASVFMGDSGSLLLGFSLAALTLSNEGVRGSRSDVVSVIIGPVFVLLLPIFDTTLVTVMRILSGRSPAVGGRDHSSHRLVAIGLSERTAVFVLWLLAAVGGLIGLTVRSATQGFSLLVGGLFLIFMALFAMYLSRVHVYGDAGGTAPPIEVTPLGGELMYKKRVFEVLIDFGLIIASYYSANSLYFDQEGYLAHSEVFYGSLPLVLAAQLVAFFVVGVYRGPSENFSARLCAQIVTGAALASAGAWVVIELLYGPPANVAAILTLYAALLTVLVIAGRSIERLVSRALSGA